MQLILLENVLNLGVLGDQVNVKPGYARNFLIPHGKAVAATPENQADFEARRAELEQQQAQVAAGAQSRAEALEGLSITVQSKAGEEGKLFGSVGAQDIANAATAAGQAVQRGEVRLPESIRQTGEYQVSIHLHADLDATITLTVEAER